MNACIERHQWLHANAATLKQTFEVSGRFYSSPAHHLCRDELLITRRQCPVPSGAHPDAVFVMMNPGECAPLQGGDTSAREYAAHAPARPDPTQYQVMRLMGNRCWDIVRVLNLCDLRTPRSGELGGRVLAYEQDEGHDGHSIFSALRKADLELALCRTRDAPVIAAWGVDRKLRPLAQRALDALRGSGVIGLNGSAETWKFRHPLPRNALAQSAWLHDMASLLDS